MHSLHSVQLQQQSASSNSKCNLKAQFASSFKSNVTYTLSFTNNKAIYIQYKYIQKYLHE